MSSSTARKRLLVLWLAAAVLGVAVGVGLSWWAGLIVFLIGDAWVLVRVLAGARAAQLRRLALAADSAPVPEPTPGRTIWKFTSWHGPASTGPKRTAPRATFRRTNTATYAPYAPAKRELLGNEDSAPPE